MLRSCGSTAGWSADGEKKKQSGNKYNFLIAFIFSFGRHANMESKVPSLTVQALWGTPHSGPPRRNIPPESFGSLPEFWEVLGNFDRCDGRVRALPRHPTTFCKRLTKTLFAYGVPDSHWFNNYLVYAQRNYGDAYKPDIASEHPSRNGYTHNCGKSKGFPARNGTQYFLSGY